MKIGKIDDPSYVAEVRTRYGPEAELRLLVDAAVDDLLGAGIPVETFAVRLANLSPEASLLEIQSLVDEMRAACHAIKGQKDSRRAAVAGQPPAAAEVDVTGGL